MSPKLISDKEKSAQKYFWKGYLAFPKVLLYAKFDNSSIKLELELDFSGLEQTELALARSITLQDTGFDFAIF